MAGRPLRGQLAHHRAGHQRPAPGGRAGLGRARPHRRLLPGPEPDAPAGQPHPRRGGRDGGGAARDGGDTVPGDRRGGPAEARRGHGGGRRGRRARHGRTRPPARTGGRARARAGAARSEDALSTGRVLRIEYGDREGATTTRDIEPLGYIGKTGHWYLLAWCRLRDALRAFRTDRIVSVHVTAEVPEPRELRREDLDIPYGVVHQLSLS
ncbi:helix-turn-helix transcriptional regulator [Streptomyces sp. NBC_00304]|uniref:helix-turn-helix transcriptional regulator n=1 Tax=Streptomyces sp. NBC_00304 TaxID=2975706 RepID=UPI002E2881EF|nr:WYL domain-containing protein [Streptomyces sp. NBC_00304]